MNKEIQTELSISRTRSNKDEGCVSVTIVDKASRVAFLRLSVPLEAFAEALLGLGNVACTGEVRGLDKVGLRREIQTVVVTIDSGLLWKWNGMVSRETARDSEDFRKFIAPYEVDGWQFSDFTGRGTPMPAQGKSQITMVLYRFVDASPTSPPAPTNADNPAAAPPPARRPHP